MKARQGFTLIEILVVLGIIAIVFTISVPFFSRFASGARLKGGAREISSVLQAARSYATTRHRAYYVNFDLEKGEFWISYNDPKAGERIVEKIFSLPQAVDITQTDFTDDRVEFKPTGGAVEGGSIWVADKRGNIRRIVVSKVTGSVRIEKERR